MSVKQANSLSKEYIKSRMIKNAASYWGYADSDIDSFDPVVKLLIESCATEIYKLTQEINSSQVRTLERLSSLLTPEVYTGSKPAHSIMFAKSVEPVCELHEGIQFFHQKKISSKLNGPLDTIIDLFFVPLTNQKIVDGAIKYSASGSNLFSYNENNNREFFLKTRSGNKVNESTLWISVSLNEKITSLDDLAFYFDWRNQPDKSSLYKLLSATRWELDGNEMVMRYGLDNYLKHQNSEMEDADQVAAQKVQKEIFSIYKNRYVSFNGFKNDFKYNPYDSLKFYPEEFEDSFSPEDLKQLTEKHIWIKVKFPALFNESLLEDTFVSINCFPVVNKKLNQLRYRLPLNINIVPLIDSTGDFFCIKSLTGANNLEYHSSPLQKESDATPGTYTLRNRGVERFDDRNGKEFLEYLLELLRDESSAFAALGHDFLISSIRALNQDISLLEQKMIQNSSEILNDPMFIMMNPREDGEILYIEYWSTNGQTANNIRSGTKMELYTGSDVQKESIVLMLNTQGGADKLSNEETLNAYRYSLLTRDRIITTEDIKSFFRFELSTRMKNVEVVRGVKMSNNPNEGLIKCVNIIITPTAHSLSNEEWEQTLLDLQEKLESKSNPFTNFSLSLKEK